MLHVKTHEINQSKRFISRHRHDILWGGGLSLKSTITLFIKSNVFPRIVYPEETTYAWIQEFCPQRRGGGGRTRHILFAEGIGSITNIFCYLIQLLWIVLAPSVHTPPPHFLSVIEHEVKREAK